MTATRVRSGYSTCRKCSNGLAMAKPRCLEPLRYLQASVCSYTAARSTACQVAKSARRLSSCARSWFRSNAVKLPTGMVGSRRSEQSLQNSRASFAEAPLASRFTISNEEGTAMFASKLGLALAVALLISQGTALADPPGHEHGGEHPGEAH